ncbi:hypothetical protein BOTNAR_0016g00050 [Botryotinia narcissicola]|uniref:C2H2-type domain-containing protein n=1 Tax=Botryotinia narcissicola TaxID=278944 RepID=A0A4Z1JC10_9HELO|nr:hypothetical protein BOTNAR_0016g00050 [Botryotinia narcissicola]
MAGGTADEQATLGELHNDVFSEVPPSNDDEMPDTPNSPSTQNPPNKGYNYVDTEQVKRYTCPYCTKSYISTRESISHIAPIDMEQAEVLKCPHCEVPSIREKLEFTEEIIEARLKKSYIPISTGAKRFLCPYCKRAFNTTFETMWTIVPELTEQGELLTCLYCQKSSLRTTLESHSDTMFREFPQIAIPADETSPSNNYIHLSHQTSSPDQALTGRPSSQFLEGIIHMPASQNSPNQEPAFQTILNQQLAIQNTTNQYSALELPPNQQLAFQPISNEQPLSNLNSHQQPTYQPELYQQPIPQSALQQQPAFQITLDQRSGIQDITNRYPAFQTAFDQQPAFQTIFDQQPAIQNTTNHYSAFQTAFDEQPAFQPNSNEQPVSNSNSRQPPTLQSNLYQQQPAVHPNPSLQPAFQITLDQRTGIQNITDQYPAFQTAFDQQSASQPSLNRQSISQLSFNQQSTFSPTHRQQPVFQSNLSQQPMARPTLDQQPPVISNWLLTFLLKPIHLSCLHAKFVAWDSSTLTGVWNHIKAKAANFECAISVWNKIAIFTEKRVMTGLRRNQNGVDI